MALDAMDLDPHPTGPARQTSPEKDRKRKHKDTTSPSKKKRKHESDATSSKKSSKKSQSKPSTSTSKPTTPDSPYTLTTATLYLPLSPISISPTHALASLLAEHLSPLLLTYYAPLKGIVLAYSNASISSTPPPTSTNIVNAEDPNLPQPLTLARTAGEYGVLYVYLTATFLVFRPQRGQILEGWVNVQSEGFLGAIVLNLFSVGIERKRLPPSWKWIPPGEELEEEQQQQQTSTNSATEKEDNNDEDSDSSSTSEGQKKKSAFDPAKELFRPIALAEDVNPLADTDPTSMNATNNNNATGDYDDDETAAAEGYFQSVSGHRVRGTIKFRVVDVDVIPGSERESGFLSIEGTMLDEEEEKRVLEEERTGVVSSAPSAPSSSYGGSGSTGMTPRKLGSVTTMSGALAIRSASASVAPELEPEVVDVHVEESPSKTKKSSSSKEKKEKKEKKSKSSKKEKSRE
ncbi:DNA-directed RNA polymerase I subunit RPA43 [Aspergillus vadensis CBS 113365]|uniref:DNA-directed RNA polymerase subunit n=1 Tax=Aspergillus vadensis (strain CBS 113365 / IMI 142717 / IBT 24658) TaxID=1448311 RepID=A0A319AWS8_ASPVC|nr:hypothetical protein BO88DRAFT_408742 [Aspergillus vadensis CBS 113365]PYH64074.1 hypothetical protein BO88DRAFT_408742 [Aspergillus vadensis CBS 113365]